jgi:hypothetical protein
MRRAAVTAASWAAAWAVLWAFTAACLLVLKAPTLREPHYWDALGCYVFQPRTLMQSGFDFGRVAQVYGFVRPPGLTLPLALVMRLVGDTPVVLRAFLCLISALAPTAAALLALRLGAPRWAAGAAWLLTLAQPGFFAQSDQVLSDLPAATFAALALLSLLSGRIAAYVLLATLAVLTKESCYFVAICGAVLLLGRAYLAARRPGPGPVNDREGEGPLAFLLANRGRALRLVLLAGLPGVPLALWLLHVRALTGGFVAAEQSAVLGPGSLPFSLLHNYIDGGRFLLWLCAVPFLFWLRSARGAAALEGGVVLFYAAAFPIFFPAALPRYMLPTLPPLAALAGLGLFRLHAHRPALPALALPAVLGLLCLGHRGLYSLRDVAHLEMSMAYRDMLRQHLRAARDLATLRPRLVLADFPMNAVLSAPPADGILPAPLPVRSLRGDEPLEELCQADVLTHAQNDLADRARQALARAGALQPLSVYDGPLRTARTDAPLRGEHDSTVRTYLVRCRGFWQAAQRP